jgi:hypothetical protein
LSSWVLKVDYNFTGTPILKRVKTIYDVHPFDLYEFDVDFSQYENQWLRVKFIATDDNLPTKTLISEHIYISEKLEDCLMLNYYRKDLKNTSEMFYETGIQNTIRLPFEKISDSPTSNIEIHKGDDKITVLNADYYEGDLIEFSPLTKELSKKLELALLHSYLSINNISYRSSEKPEKEHLEESNLYTVKAKLIKGEGSLELNSYGLISESEPIETPALIITDEGFISY